MDFAHNETEKKLKKLEKEIDALYRQALREIKVELENYPSWDRILSIKDKKERLRKAKRRSDFQLLIKHISIIIQNKNKLAIAIIEDRIIDIYNLNYEWEAYNIEKNSLYDLNYTLYSKEAIIELLKETTPIFTKIAFKHAKDIDNIIRDLKRELGVAIIKGDSINNITKRVAKVTGKNSFNSRRIARTETTRIQNSGRMNAIVYGQDMGLELRKQWISTIDSHTRDRHLHLNLKIVPMDKEFETNLKYPGDPNASAEQTINCRCTMVSVLNNIKPTLKEKQLDATLANLTFNEWRKRREN